MYSQTYIVKSVGSDLRNESVSRHAFFQCGPSCYTGEIKLGLEHAFGDVTLKDIPALVPLVQRQQGDLTYLCDSSNVPVSNSFYLALNEMEWSRNFVIQEITSDSINAQMMKLRNKHCWIDDESQVYFELIGDAASRFENILFVACRSYAHELCFITIYFEGSIYVTVQEATGDQPLLDINFPDISVNGAGVTLALYDDDGKGSNGPWMKLSVWQVQSASHSSEEVDVPEVAVEPLTKDLSNDCYVQAYIILKGETDVRDVMFRFGNWCYDGKVTLIPKLSLADIPFVIPAVRVQQSKMDFVSEITSLPSSSPFAAAMEHAAQRQSRMRDQAVDSEQYLRNLITDQQLLWIEDENNDTFFEFTCVNEGNGALESVDLLAVKSYDPNGIISVSIYFGGNWYHIIEEGGEDFPLLDSKFPDLSRKSIIHSIQSFPDGIDGWPQLRELSICCSKDPRDAEHEQITTTAEDPSNNDEVEQHVSRLESKLENIDSGDDSGAKAWDADGKPLKKDCEASAASFFTGGDLRDEPKLSADEVVAGEGGTLHEGDDIYAQLDRLDQQLNNEIEELKELGVLDDNRSSK